MNVLFFIVNYKADEHLLRLLASISEAVRFAPGVEVQVTVLDNSLKPAAEADALASELKKVVATVEYLSSDSNLGYFGGLSLAQERSAGMDSIIYCNPDVSLAPDFLLVLASLEKDPAVWAPDIVVTATGYRENPKNVERMDRSKLSRLRRIYANGFTYALFTLLGQSKERLLSLLHRRETPAVSQNRCSIYAAHGALFVFADVDFFRSLPAYPCFLFGEELFVAEEALKVNKTIVYEPSLKVFDSQHGSVGLLNLGFRRSLYFVSVDYLLNHYSFRS